MTLRKLLFNQPGNIQEVAQFATKSNSPINILYQSTWEADQTGFQLIRGHIIYSLGTREEELARTNRRFIDSLPQSRCFATSLMDMEVIKDASERIILRLKKRTEPTLKYFDSCGLKYNLFELMSGL